MEYTVSDVKPDDDGKGQLCCPECQAVWLDFKGWSETVDEGTCEHLMFCWIQECDFTCKGLTDEALSEVLISEAARVAGDDEVIDASDASDVIIDKYYDREFWEKINIPGVDCMLEYIVEGIAGGQCTESIYFGFKRKA